MAASKKAKGTVQVVLENPQPKKAVTRYDATDENAALANAYITHAALASLGNPERVRITIEAA